MPTTEQEILLAKHFGCVRYIYNHFLAQRIETYQDTKIGSNYIDDANELPTIKKALTWLTEVSSQSLQCAVKHLQLAYENFFRKCRENKKGKKGFPVFKKKIGKQSFRIPQGTRTRIINNKLILPKFLEGIELILHRPCVGKIKFATVSKNRAGKYYVSITVEKEIVSLEKTDQVIGLDLNVKHIVDNKGNRTLNPRPGYKYKKPLKKLAQRISRKEKGSKNRAKARLKYSKLKQYVYNIREDFLHKLSRSIVNKNQVICIEDLNVENMVKNAKPDERKEPRWEEKKRHKDILDCAFYSFAQKLCYKALWYGRTLIKINRYFPSSKTCHKCGWIYKDLEPHEREWTCFNCWERNDRDHNAAENILDEGMKTCGIQGLDYCPDVRPKKFGLLVG